MSSLNKVLLIGNLGKDPDIRSMQNGNRVCNMSLATSEKWKDKQTGERRERTEWHRIVVFNEGLVGICEKYLRKGSKIYLEGQVETRKYTDQNDNERYITEIVLRPYKGEIVMLDTRQGEQGGYDQAPLPNQGEPERNPDSAPNNPPHRPPPNDGLDDEIPF